mmetsp:Transcript_16188/g.26318  ORF Transcript_16188/g.26318 Transcript_16188/m.26318 type:complete len:103 (-) Transcript_16188:210-518(-)
MQDEWRREGWRRGGEEDWSLKRAEGVAVRTRDRRRRVEERQRWHQGRIREIIEKWKSRANDSGLGQEPTPWVPPRKRVGPWQRVGGGGRGERSPPLGWGWTS